jgi:hypothetical protein
MRRQVGDGEVMGHKVLKNLAEGVDREERRMQRERKNGKGLDGSLMICCSRLKGLEANKNVICH